jgi:hypothetical protein
MVSDAVEGFSAEIQRARRNVGTPHGMVESFDEYGEGILGGMAAGAVAAVVAESDRLRERHVEPAGPGYRSRDLRHF